MTVAQIRDSEGAPFVEVVFLESARFYKLYRNHPAFDDLLRVLRRGMATGNVVKVGFAAPESDVIEDVE
jgi:hypothetical protein